MATIPLKQHIKQHCLTVLSEKINAIQSSLESVNEAANNETKSTAGDKHETGRAMMQLEQEKLSKQLNELFQLQSDLEKISLDNPEKKIKKGCLIETDKGWFFIGIGLGKLLVDQQTVFAISEQSPIGKILLQIGSSSSFEFNGAKFILKSIH